VGVKKERVGVKKERVKKERVGVKKRKKWE